MARMTWCRKEKFMIIYINSTYWFQSLVTYIQRILNFCYLKFGGSFIISYFPYFCVILGTSTLHQIPRDSCRIYSRMEEGFGTISCHTLASFYRSCEMQCQPLSSGWPYERSDSAIAADGRGNVITCSYRALNSILMHWLNVGHIYYECVQFEFRSSTWKETILQIWSC